MKCVFCFTGLFALSFNALFAQGTRPIPKQGSSYVRLLESSTQRVLPGQRGTPPFARYSFILIWKSTQPPNAFYWYSGSNWMSCAVSKVHKFSNPLPNGVQPLGSGYKQERIGLDNVKKDDTLELTPLSEIDKPVSYLSLFKPGNIFIVYKTKKNKWLYTRVKEIAKAPDMAMP